MSLNRRQFPFVTKWLREQPEEIAVPLEAGIRYLCEHGKQADLPDVRHKIQTSAYYPEMSEVRFDEDTATGRVSMRILTCFVDAGATVLVCVAGDKHGYLERTGRDWYADYVPVADLAVKKYVDQGGHE